MEKNNLENISQTLFNEKSLYLLNIRDLRDIGRRFGVPSPSTLKKRELVDYILKIVYGEVDIPVRSACGRPSVRSFDMDKYISKIKGNGDISEELSKYKVFADYGMMTVASPSESYLISEKIENRVFYTDGNKCALRVRQFVESPEDIEISKELATKLHLENFDVLEILEIDGMFKIITINGIKVEDKFEGLEIAGRQTQKGTTENFYLRTKEEVKEEITKIEKHSKKQNIKLIIFSEEEHSGNLTECVTYNDLEDHSMVYKKFMLFTSICEQAIYDCEDVIVVVENLEDVENMIDSFDEDISERIKKHLHSVITKIVTLGNVFVTFKLENEITY